MGIAGRGLNIGLLTAIVVAILLIQVGYDIYARLGESGPGAEYALAGGQASQPEGDAD